MFARAWAAWFGAHHERASVSSDRYLDAAEPFVAAFIAAGCKAAANGDLGATTSRADATFQVPPLPVLVVVVVPCCRQCLRPRLLSLLVL